MTGHQDMGEFLDDFDKRHPTPWWARLWINWQVRRAIKRMIRKLP